MKKRESTIHYPLYWPCQTLDEKNFSGIPSVIMINMRIGRPFVVSTHSINIYLIRKLVEGLNMLNNEYCHGFRKISYLLVVARTKQ